MALLLSRRGLCPLAGIFLLSGLFAAPSARAGDGVLEINQTCAQTGCFPGDGGGLPVTISESGSYRLTSKLEGTSDSIPVILIQAEPVTLDLNGFDVRGSFGGPNPGGVGILGGNRVALRNGSVHHAASDGVRVGGSSRVEDLHVYGNAGAGVVVAGESTVRGVVATSNVGVGISAGAASVVAGCTATANGGHGLGVVSGSVTASTATQNSGSGGSFGDATSFSANHFAGNGAGDMSGGHASAGNFCGDGSCTSDGRRRYYLTTTSRDGASAPGSCDAGFHMASIWEILQPSHLDYDARGFAHAAPGTDGEGLALATGQGGWIRTGGGPSISTNCISYGTSGSLESGTLVRLPHTWMFAGSPPAGTWTIESDTCDELHPVWCIED